MTRFENFKNMSARDLAQYICDNVLCDSCPISRFDDLYYKPYCPARGGQEIKMLTDWLESEVSDR